MPRSRSCRVDLGIEPTGIVDAATLNALEDALEALETSLTTPTTTEEHDDHEHPVTRRLLGVRRDRAGE